MKLEFSSEFNIDADELWCRINNFEKLNRELWPVIRMTCPSKYLKIPFENFPIGRQVFESKIFLFGFIPVELSKIKFITVASGKGFAEDSEMVLSSSWKHERTLHPCGRGVMLVDNLDISPRLSLLKPLLFAFVNIVFFNRHRRLGKLLKANKEAL